MEMKVGGRRRERRADGEKGEIGSWSEGMAGE
jgi:hypothetical protein